MRSALATRRGDSTPFGCEAGLAGHQANRAPRAHCAHPKRTRWAFPTLAAGQPARHAGTREAIRRHFSPGRGSPVSSKRRRHQHSSARHRAARTVSPARQAARVRGKLVWKHSMHGAAVSRRVGLDCGRREQRTLPSDRVTSHSPTPRLPRQPLLRAGQPIANQDDSALTSASAGAAVSRAHVTCGGRAGHA